MMLNCCYDMLYYNSAILPNFTNSHSSLFSESIEAWYCMIGVRYAIKKPDILTGINFRAISNLAFNDIYCQSYESFV